MAGPQRRSEVANRGGGTGTTVFEVLAEKPTGRVGIFDTADGNLEGLRPCGCETTVLLRERGEAASYCPRCNERVRLELRKDNVFDPIWTACADGPIRPSTASAASPKIASSIASQRPISCSK